MSAPIQPQSAVPTIPGHYVVPVQVVQAVLQTLGQFPWAQVQPVMGPLLQITRQQDQQAAAAEIGSLAPEE